MAFNDKTTIILPLKLKTELKIMCALTNRRMSDFIRIAIQEKIKELNQKRLSDDENLNES